MNAAATWAVCDQLTPDPRVWERVAPWIADALATGGGTHELEDVHHAIRAGRMQLWAGERCALVTELVDYPRLRAVRIFCAGGHLNDALAELLDMERRVVAFGKVNGATRCELIGREGWKRVFGGKAGTETRVFMWHGL